MNKSRKCQCECGCISTATTEDEGTAVCAECAEYAYDAEGMFLGCGASGLGETCPRCGEDIHWGGILTGDPGSGTPNYRWGECGCGVAWREEDRGGWGNYFYSAG